MESDFTYVTEDDYHIRSGVWRTSTIAGNPSENRRTKKRWKLNLGSGGNYKQGFINIDTNKKKG